MMPTVKTRLGFSWIIVLSLLILQHQGGDAYHITVEKVECVSEYVGYDGDLVSGNFVVVNKQSDWYSDNDDVEMVVTGPSGTKVMSLKAKGGQKFQFKAPKLGHYKICFFNPTTTTEQVDFAIHVGHVLNPDNVAKDEHFNPVEGMIMRLRDAVERVSLEQQYYKSRDARHRLTNESTNNRLIWYTLAEYVALIGFSVAQVYLVRRLFSKRIGYNKF